MINESNLPEIQDIFTKEENSRFNSNSFYDVDWNEQYKIEIRNIFNKVGLTSIPTELQAEWDAFLKRYADGYTKQLQIRRSNPSPSVVGPSGFNYRRRDKLMARERKTSELNDKLVSSFHKKVRRYRFEQNKFLPNAEERRQLRREESDKVISFGTKVKDVIFGTGTVIRVNKKTYTVKYDSGFKKATDKSFVKPLENDNQQAYATSKNIEGTTPAVNTANTEKQQLQEIQLIRTNREQSRDELEQNI